MLRRLLLLLVLAPTPLIAATGTADGIITKLQASYDSVKSIQAGFEQTYRSTRFGDRKNRGTVTVMKPGKMRWDYDDPKGKVLVANGETIMLFDPEDQQVLSGPQPKKGSLPVGLAFLWGEGKLKELFNIALVSESSGKDGPTATLHCMPKESVPNVSDVELVVRLTDPVLVVTSRVIDSMGGINEIRFSNFKLNSTLTAKTFEFIPPKGIPIVPFSSPDENTKNFQ